MIEKILNRNKVSLFLEHPKIMFTQGFFKLVRHYHKKYNILSIEINYKPSETSPMLPIMMEGYVLAILLNGNYES